MPLNKVVIDANTNFHHISGKDLFKSAEKRFMEYRKRWESWPKDFYTGNFPLFIDIEVTSACNLKCRFCATTFRGSKIKKGFISFKHVRKIIDEGSEKGLFGVKFNIRGEPLLHPQIDEFVSYAKKKNLIDVYFNTNGMLLTAKMAQKLIDAGLDRISVSFEGYTKKQYERHRVGARFETVVSNIDSIQRLKKKLGVKFPKVRIQTVMLPEIKLDFDKYKEFWHGRVDEVAYLDYKEMEGKHRGVEFPWACPQLWQRMAIWWDGTILPCNHDDDGLLALANIDKSTIAQAWLSKKINEIRCAHKAGCAHSIPACDGCYLRDSEISKLRLLGA